MLLMLLNILPHFLLQNFFPYYSPLKPRCVLWSEKYGSYSRLGAKLKLKGLLLRLVTLLDFLKSGFHDGRVKRLANLSLKPP